MSGFHPGEDGCLDSPPGEDGCLDSRRKMDVWIPRRKMDVWIPRGKMDVWIPLDSKGGRWMSGFQKGEDGCLDSMDSILAYRIFMLCTKDIARVLANLGSENGDRAHSARSFVALSVMWRPMKAPVAGQDGACIGRHINELAAARARLLTAARTGCVIERHTGVCPRRLKPATSGNTHSRVRPARNKCTGAGN